MRKSLARLGIRMTKVEEEMVNTSAVAVNDGSTGSRKAA
jgi:hypothetical protein